MTGEEERMAMLAGRDLDALDAAEREQLAAWTRLLADPEVWAEPAPGLEDAVLSSINNATMAPTRAWSSSTGRTGSWVRPLLAGLAVAAAIIAVVLLFNQHSRERFGSAALAGTVLAPKAHGEAAVYQDAAGFRIELKANGLPLLDGGRFYQAWLRSATGDLVPVGTFSKGDGQMVTLWSGVSPAHFPTLSITIEKPDGNQASSGQRVLAGTISA
jgi:hypothetical protein